ncbi:MAG: aminoglycoside phosphotransferase family protein [Candidatus Nitrosocosmicus sp.]|nr:aminoglycoside phosphotransferase family protein [Candidatus Nitrosocosmicus sp.]
MNDKKYVLKIFSNENKWATECKVYLILHLSDFKHITKINQAGFWKQYNYILFEDEDLQQFPSFIDSNKYATEHAKILGKTLRRIHNTPIETDKYGSISDPKKQLPPLKIWHNLILKHEGILINGGIKKRTIDNISIVIDDEGSKYSKLKRPSLLHRDFRTENILYKPDKISNICVIDWEVASIGHPYLDMIKLVWFEFRNRIDLIESFLIGYDDIAIKDDLASESFFFRYIFALEMVVYLLKKNIYLEDEMRFLGNLIDFLNSHLHKI